MRRWSIAAAAVLALGVLGAPAGADLPPSLNPLRFSVFLSSAEGNINYSFSPLLNPDTGKGSLTVTEADQGFPPTAGVTFDFQLDVDAAGLIDYTLTLVNGSSMEIPLQAFFGSPMEPFDQTSDAQHSLTVDVTDVNGGGATLTPDQFNFDRNDRTLQQAFSNGVDFLRPPHAQSFGAFLGDGDLFSSDSPLGAGRVSRTSGPKRIPTPQLFDLTPDGKYNNASINTSFKLSAGDSVTLTGQLKIAKGLVGGGGNGNGNGNGGGDGYQPVSGSLDGKQVIKVPKIGKINNKQFAQGVMFGETTFSFQDGPMTIGGAAEVKKNGKLIKLSLDEGGKLALEQLIANKLSGEAGGPVTVALRKEPKGKGVVKKGGEKSKFVFSAKFRATAGDVTKNGVYKVALKGSLSPDT